MSPTSEAATSVTLSCSHRFGLGSTDCKMVKNSLRKKAEAVAMEEEKRYYSDENESADDGSNGSSEEDDIEYLSIATGLDTNCAMDMVDVLRQAEENNLNFVCVPLFHPRLRVGEIARN